MDQPLRLAEGEHSTVTASTLSIDRTGAISRVKKALTVHVRAHTVVGRMRADLAMVTRAGKCDAKRDQAFVCIGAGAVTVRQGQRGGRRLEPSLDVYM